MEVGDSLLGATGPGKHVDLVASIEGLQKDLAVCRGNWRGELFLVKGWTQPFSGLWALYDYVRTDDVDGIPCLEPGVDACGKQHVYGCSASYRNLVELCAGMGGISLGAQAACVHTCLFVDNKGAQVLQADIIRNSRCTCAALPFLCSCQLAFPASPIRDRAVALPSKTLDPTS